MRVNTSVLEVLTAKQGMNFSQLAEKAVVSRQTLSTIKGRKSCAAATLCRIAAALDVDVTELMEEAYEIR